MCSFSSKLLTETIVFFTETLTFLSSQTSDPLFSIFITLYTLILLYFPQFFLTLLFSPIVISTSLLLSTLLRLGSTQPPQTESATEPSQCFIPEPEPESAFDSKLMMVEWNRDIKAPLQVIYEEHEGEDENHSDQMEENQALGIDKSTSLSLYYPESDTESSSDDGDYPLMERWDSVEKMCFRWDEEDDRDGLIEIPLDGKRFSGIQLEEENMIEIDIMSAGAPMGM